MAVLFLAAFVIRELIVKDPSVHFHLLHIRIFATGICLATILGFVLYGTQSVDYQESNGRRHIDENAPVS
jgi:hypothetical protein